MTKNETGMWIEFEAKDAKGYDVMHVTYYKKDRRFFVSGTRDGYMGLPYVEFTLDDLGVTSQITHTVDPRIAELIEALEKAKSTIALLGSTINGTQRSCERWTTEALNDINDVLRGVTPNEEN